MLVFVSSCRKCCTHKHTHTHQPCQYCLCYSDHFCPTCRICIYTLSCKYLINWWTNKYFSWGFNWWWWEKTVTNHATSEPIGCIRRLTSGRQRCSVWGQTHYSWASIGGGEFPFLTSFSMCCSLFTVRHENGVGVERPHLPADLFTSSKFTHH